MRKNRMLVRTTLALAAVAALATIGVGAASARQANITVTGAGSTFVAPLVQEWVSPVASQLHLTLNYSAVGSGAGIAAITNRTVDFGASDAPLQSSSSPRNCRRLSPDSVGSRRHRGRLPPRRCQQDR